MIYNDCLKSENWFFNGGILVSAPSNGAIYDKFSEQHQHQSTIFNALAQLALNFGADLMHTLVGI